MFAHVCGCPVFAGQARFVNIGERPHTPPKLAALLSALLSSGSGASLRLARSANRHTDTRWTCSPASTATQHPNWSLMAERSCRSSATPSTAQPCWPRCAPAGPLNRPGSRTHPRRYRSSSEPRGGAGTAPYRHARAARPAQRQAIQSGPASPRSGPFLSAAPGRSRTGGSARSGSHSQRCP